MKPPGESRSKREIKAELEELEPMIYEARWAVESAEEELNTAEAKLADLRELQAELKDELDPLLRPWERARAKAERKITAWVQVING
jgi:chromosome segregation ATPase